MTRDADDGGEPDGGDADAVDERLRRLHEHLAATRERPVERTASRWIGEADAVAADLADADLDRSVVRERVGHVRELLANVERTGDDDADEHVAAAARIADDVAAALDGE